MTYTGMRTGNIGVQLLNFVSKTCAYQKIERAVCDRGLRPFTLATQYFEDVISPHRPMLLKQDFQNTAACRGEVQLGGNAMLFHGAQCVVDAGFVIMVLKTDCSHGGPLASFLDCML